MRFTEIPDDEAKALGGDRVVFGPPPGDDPGVLMGCLEVLMRPSEAGPPMHSARVELEPGDLELLAAGKPFYVTQYGGVCPLSVDIPFERVAVPDDASSITETEG